MQILKINALCGIKNQMYCADQYVNADKPPKIQDGFLDINSIFWSKIFDPKHVKEILSLAKSRLNNDFSPKIQAVINNPELFFETYIKSLKALDVTVEQQILFESLETLEIICHLHSKIYSSPFVLTITQGYIHSSFSAQDLEHICCLPYYNPYLSFIESEIIPQIRAYNPDILLLSGKPNIASFAIAKIIREQIDKVFIVSIEHESDYYSLRKIRNLLLTNTAFFSVYHCVVLGNTQTTIEEIKKNFWGRMNINLSSIPNIIYSIDNGNTIHQTKEVFSQKSLEIINNVNKEEVLNIKAFPENHCYWNQCSFCGINSKYLCREKQTWNVDALILKMKKVYNLGGKKVWFLDETIPVNILCQFAKQLLANNIYTIWHMRTKIEPNFVNESLVKLLRQAGLRHILFGFESASSRILKIANKNNNNFNYVDTAEKIVSVFTSNKIAVHFSAILGFPTETNEERKETCEYLEYLLNTYGELFSYNVNVFYLDIGSKMYEHWEYFNISNLSFPCAPKYFLGNHLDWNSYISPNKFSVVKCEQINIMKRQYSWYPEDALLNPCDFFSFWEYSRYCLQESPIVQNQPVKTLLLEKFIVLSPMVSFCKFKTDSWLLYHMKNHHFVIGGSILRDLIDANRKNISFKSIINSFEMPYQNQVKSLIANLTRMDFFILDN